MITKERFALRRGRAAEGPNRRRGGIGRRLARGSYLLALALLVVFALPAGASASVSTDQSSYAPGSVVTISGNNEALGGYEPGEKVVVSVTDPEGTQSSCEATADLIGAWSCHITLASDTSAIGAYSYTAVGQTSKTEESGSFSDSGCPDVSSLKDHTRVDPTISASLTTSGGVATYSFKSTDESPTKGVPGMIEYCVYTEPQPDETKAKYSDWITGSGGGFFDFERKKGGTGDNLPLDGKEYEVGTATWISGKVPAKQVVLCHIDDPGAGKEDAYVRCLETGGGATPAEDLTASKTANPALTRTYKWGIEKAVDHTRINSAGAATFNYTVSVTHDGGTDSKWSVSGKISVTNPNAAAVSGVNVADSINDAGASCTVTGGTSVSIPAESAVSLPYSCTYSAEPTSTSETNTAEVQWPTQTLAGGAVLTGNTIPATAPVVWAEATVTPVDGSVSVSDPLGGGVLGSVSSSDPSPRTFPYAHTFSGDPAGTCTTHENTATFTTSDSHTQKSASQSVEHCVGADLTTSKTATPSFTRTYKWGIGKTVDKSEVHVQPGAPASFKYTVSVTHDAGTDSGWQVLGTITVKNPNDWEAIALSGVTDAIDNGGSCSITSGNPTGSVPAGGSVSLGYTCTYSAAPTPASFTNKATASWDKSTAATAHERASGEAGGEFTSPTTVVDGSVSIADTLDGTLGPISSGDPSPTTFEYTHEFTGDPAGTCTTHENTATFTTSTTGAQKSASQSVKVCVEPSCTKIYGAGHWGLKTPAGDTLDDNLTINPGYTGKEQFAWVWEISPGVHSSLGLQKAKLLTCVRIGTETIFSGHGLATVSGVKGYEVSFRLTVKPTSKPLVYLWVALEKAGVVLQEWNINPLATGKQTVS